MKFDETVKPDEIVSPDDLVELDIPDGDEPPIVTLVSGTSFVRCSPSGTIQPGGHAGYFAGDTRLLSVLDVRIGDAPVRRLNHHVAGASLTTLGTVGPEVRPRLGVTIRLTLGRVLELRVDLEHLEADTFEGLLNVTVMTDFADVFDVKRGVTSREGFVSSARSGDDLVLNYDNDGFTRGLRVSSDVPCRLLRDGVDVDLHLAARATQSVRLVFRPELGEGDVAPDLDMAGSFRTDLAETGPTIETRPPELARSVRRGVADLFDLLLADPDAPQRPIIAAGSPWFMALFGRDSLVTGWQSLPLGPELALGTLEALADRQGRANVPTTAEQPGRILHEVRGGEVVRRSGGWGEVYYGSVDATPLFVMLLAEAWRWGAAPDRVAALMPAAERAVAWIEGSADASGDGFVETSAPTDGVTAALLNQSWKDSDDSIRHPDGSIAEGPVSTVEVQAYCESALRALASLRDGLGLGTGEELRARAADRRAAIDAAFWLEDEQCYALALDAAGAPVASVSSNAGHLLWTGTALPERRQPLARRLTARDMSTGHGLRTLSSATSGYNPLSYHCGSVWPHDTAIVAAGLLAAGCREEGRQLALALSSSAGRFGGRLPELFGGFDAEQHPSPVPYPTACSPQAWAAGAPLLLVRALLGIDPDVPAGVVRIDPCLPDGMEVEVRGLQLGAGRLNLRAVGEQVEECEIVGSASLRVLHEPRGEAA